MTSGQIRYHFIPMDLKTFRSNTLRALADATADAGEARAMERVILEDILLLTPALALADPERDVPDFIVDKVDAIIRKVAGGMPLQYALGRARFYGMDLKVSPAVLIPRPETEQLVDMIVDRMGGRPDLRVLDLGTGSGCIALALARSLKFPEVTAVDISEDALRIARANAEALRAKVNFRYGDILSLEGLEDEWDVIVSNPPYVLESEAGAMERHVLDHEPHLALFVPDADPMKFYRPVIDYWQARRAPGGILFFEINPLCAREFRGAEIIKDFYGKDRFAVYR